MIKLGFGLKRYTWTPFLLFVLASPYLLAQSGGIPTNLDDKVGVVPEKPTDELIDISKLKIDQELIYGPSPWTLPDKYKNLFNSEYRREFFRMTGIEYSGLHWKQFVIIYMNIDPKVYVNNYFEYIRLYYSDDEDEDWDDEGSENDGDEGWDDSENDEDEGWDDSENDGDEGWDDSENDEDEGWDDSENDGDEGWDDSENDGDEGWDDSKGDIDSEEPNTKFEQFVPGTVLLKEHYKNENGRPGAPETITLMIKREKGYDPKANDWEYSQFDPKGKMLMEGNSQRDKIFQSCTECHANIKERDYIFTTYSSWLPFLKKDD